VAEFYNVHSLPTWYVIAPDGKIVARDPFDDALIPAVRKALGGPGT